MDAKPQKPFVSVAQLLTIQARLTPDAIAIKALQRPALTYARLLAQVEETVAALNRLGLGRGDTVALVLDNGPEMATAFLASAACAICAPLNPAYTEADFEFYLTDLGAKAVIVAAGSTSPVRQVARGLGLTVLELHPGDNAPAGCFTLTGRQADPASDPGYAGAEDIALVLHTSGTTARPKQVPLTQANLCVSAHHVATALALSATDCGLSLMPLFHIHGLVASVLAPLSAGASIACTPGFDSQLFYQWLTDFQASWYSAVPTMHQAILAAAPDHRAEIAQQPLRLIRSSSSALAPQVLKALAETFGCPVVEAYGMTEAAHQIACNPIQPGAAKARSVGLAAGPQVAIVDESGRQLGVRETGEIAIRGPNVFAGYASNPDANAKAFRNGWFLTGDQGYLDSDGYLFITGRLKEMINRGGEKIMPREVDEALMDHPAIQLAVAFAVPHPTLGEDLAVAVVPEPGVKVTESQVREFAFDRLVGFKVPSQVLFVGAIPKGPTGKLQRIGLADQLACALRQPFVAPRNETESLLTRIVEEVLGRDKIGVVDNFFALGGDSLRATQVISRIRAQTQVELPIVSLFRNPTVEKLARLVEASLRSSEDHQLQGILDELEQLPEEEIRRLLDQELGYVET